MLQCAEHLDGGSKAVLENRLQQYTVCFVAVCILQSRLLCFYLQITAVNYMLCLSADNSSGVLLCLYLQITAMDSLLCFCLQITAVDCLLCLSADNSSGLPALCICRKQQ